MVVLIINGNDLHRAARTFRTARATSDTSEPCLARLSARLGCDAREFVSRWSGDRLENHDVAIAHDDKLHPRLQPKSIPNRLRNDDLAFRRHARRFDMLHSGRLHTLLLVRL